VTYRAPEQSLKESDDRIDWVLSHPGMSEWLKDTLRAARDCDPVDLLNDLAMLDQLLRVRAEAQLKSSLPHMRHASGVSRDPRDLQR
jgi:hypothetical protein